MAKEKLVRARGGFEHALETVVTGNPVRPIKVTDIVAPKKHDRSQYDPKAIVGLAENIKQQGLLQPIIVRRLEDGKYERIAGFRRLEAIKILGEEEILARVIEANDLEALKAMLSENTQRVDLNVYDKAVFFEEIILAAMDSSECEELKGMSVRKLRSRIERLRNTKNNKITGSPSEADIIFNKIMQEAILSQYGYGIDSFSKFIGMLDFDPLIIQAIKEDKITRVLAAEINRLSTKQFKEHIPSILQRTINEGLSSREVSKIVSDIIKEKSDVNDALSKSIKKTIKLDKIPEKNRIRAEELVDVFIKEISLLITPAQE